MSNTTVPHNTKPHLSETNGHVSLDSAIRFTREWREVPQEYVKKIKAFTIRRFELQKLINHMDEIGCDAARFYTGLKPLPPTPDRPDIILYPCMLMVGVQGYVPDFENPSKSIAGTDVFFMGQKQADKNGTGYETETAAEEQFVYDFALPCPDTCAQSVLNGD